MESHLISLGLLNTEKETLDLGGSDAFHLDYFGREYVMPPDSWMILRLLENRDDLGQIRRFTAVGNELVRIIPRKEVSGFVQQVQSELSMQQIRLLSSEDWMQSQRSKGADNPK